MRFVRSVKIRRVLAAAFALGALLAGWLLTFGIPWSEEMPAGIVHDGGHAYRVTLPPPRWPLTERWDEPDSTASELAVVLNGALLGPAHAPHDNVRGRGGGAYSYWLGTLYFSMPDGGDPRADSTKPHLRRTFRTSFYVVFIFAGLAGLAWPRRRFSAAEGARAWPGLDVARWIWRNILTPVTVSVAVVGICFIAGEGYLRLTKPFNIAETSIEFDPRFGWRYVPGSEIRWTNGVDYWVRQNANRLGFADRDRSKDKAADACRVLFIGDSMVEALQVPIAEKTHVLFESFFLRDDTARKVEAAAIGYSGTGTAGQIGMYDLFGRSWAPDVVVIVAVSNDLVDSSAPLSAIAGGWHPTHAPRLAYHVREDRTATSIEGIPIDPDWQNWVPAISLPDYDVAGVRQRADRFLLRHSYAYHWLHAQLRLALPGFTQAVTGAQDVASLNALRAKWIESLQGWGGTFAGWRPPDDIALEAMFFADDLPRVFEHAVLATGRALDEFVARSREDGFKLLLLGNYSLRYMAEEKTYGRTVHPDNMVKRWRKLAEERGIPFIDQTEQMRRAGLTPRDVRFPFDGHLNARGHLSAAEALKEYFDAHPELCAR